MSEPNRWLDWKTVKAMLEKQKHRLDQIAASSPKSAVTADDALRQVVSAVMHNPGLGSCHEVSFLYAAVLAIRTGLPIGAPLNLAYVVPRYSKGVKGDWLFFDPSYMGLIALARRSQEVNTVFAQVARENDEFEWEEGSQPLIRHKPAKRDRGALTHAYGVAYLNGSNIPTIQVLDFDEVMKRKGESKGADRTDSPWRKWEVEMWKKTAIVVLSKFLPRPPELGYALGAFAAMDAHEDLEDIRAALPDPELLSLPPSNAEAVDLRSRVAERAEAARAAGRPEVAAALEAQAPRAPREEPQDERLTVTPEVAAALRDLASEAGVDTSALLKQFRSESFDDIAASDESHVRRILEARLSAAH